MRRSSRLGGLALCSALLLAPASVAAQGADADVSPPEALRGPYQPPLEGTSWRVTQYADDDTRLRPVGPEIAAWLTMRGGRLKGSTGCDAIAGRYALVGPLIAFRPKPADEAGDCTGQQRLVRGGVRRALEDATGYRIASADETGPPQLLLHAGDARELLRLVPDDVASLESGEWQLESYAVDGITTAADPMSQAVLAFDRERGDRVARRSSGALIGSSGCNGIVGRYSRSADIVRVSRLERTDAPCSPSLAAQEAAMVAVLDASALTLELPPDRLRLTSTDTGDSLAFTSSAPLEGTTWLLSRLGTGRMPQDPVTLRLAGGSLSGEGPCGPYRADYTSDGVFITIGALEGAPGRECAERRQQRQLLRALERSVMLDRPNGQLRLLDAFGTMTARFTRPGGP